MAQDGAIAKILNSGCASDAPPFPKKMERNMTEKTLEALTDEEWEMIKTIRLKSAKVPNLERGTGVDFNQAWVNINRNYTLNAACPPRLK
jgi:hypothetical protein